MRDRSISHAQLAKTPVSTGFDKIKILDVFIKANKLRGEIGVCFNNTLFSTAVETWRAVCVCGAVANVRSVPLVIVASPSDSGAALGKQAQR